MKKIIALLIVFSPLLISSKGCEEPKSSADSKIDENVSECTSDADCTTAKADCCGCRQGGKQQAVSLQKAREIEKQFAKQCEDTMCIQMVSNHESCKKTAHCDDGECNLR